MSSFDGTLSFTSIRGESSRHPSFLLQLGGEAPSVVTLQVSERVLERYANELRVGFKKYHSKCSETQALAEFANLAHAKFQEMCSGANWAGKSLFSELRSLLTLDIINEIKLIGEIAAFPFELLYLCDPASELSPAGFIGLRVGIRKSGLQTFRRGSGPNRFEIKLGEKCVLGFARHKNLRHTQNEFNYLADCEAKKMIRLYEIPEASSGRGDRIAAWINEEFQMIHFACHIEGGDGDIPRALVFHDSRVSVDDFRRANKQLAKLPFVFLNACKSGPVNAVDEDDFARVVSNGYAIGLLVTETDVRDDFAADFSRIFYNRLFSGATVADALRVSKQSYVRTSWGASGLAYSLFSPVDILATPPESS